MNSRPKECLLHPNTPSARLLIGKKTPSVLFDPASRKPDELGKRSQRRMDCSRNWGWGTGQYHRMIGTYYTVLTPWLNYQTLLLLVGLESSTRVRVTNQRPLSLSLFPSLTGYPSNQQREPGQESPARAPTSTRARCGISRFRLPT